MDLMQSLIASRLLGDGGGGGSATLITKSVTQNGTYSATDDQADGYFEVSVDVQPSLDTKTITTNGTYPASSDNLDGYSSVTVNVPDIPAVIQSLSITENGTYTAPSGVDGYNDINVEVPDIPAVLDDITITENGNYTPPSGTDGYNDITVNVPAPSNALFKQTLSNLPSPIATFTGADAPLDSLKASIIGVQSGSGDPSPSNVRPISGWSEANVTRTGVNLFDNSKAEIGTAWNGGNNPDRARFILPCKPNTKYTYSRSGSLAVQNIYAISSPTVPASSAGTVYTSFDSKTFTTNANDRYIIFAFSQTAITQNDIDSMNIQLELGETATTYEAYSGKTYTILFKDSSDNSVVIYDGNVDIADGNWLSNRLFEVFDNTATVTFGRDGQPNWYYQIAGTSTGTSGETAETISNMYSYANIGNDNDNLGIMKLPNGNIRLRVGGTQPATVDDFVNSLGVTPLQVVSKLATPQTGTFTPINIRSNGVTNISVNCGKVTELKYFSETILYNANNLQIANTSTYITADLNIALEVGKTYIGIIKDYGDWSNVPIIFTRVSGNQSITISLAQGSGTLVFTNNTVTLDPYAGDYRNIYLTLREYII